MRILLCSIVLSISFQVSLYAFFPINIFRPYDRVLMPEPWPGKCVQCTVAYEGGLEFHGFQADISEVWKKVNVLRVYQDTQNALAMLKGFDPRSPLSTLAQRLNIDDATNNRGHFLPLGCLDLKSNYMFSLRSYLPYNFIVSVHLPYYNIMLRNVQWHDLTPDRRAEDRLARQLLTSNFISRVRELGGLDITGWHRKGVGDLVVMGQWLRDFPQIKPLLKNIRLNARAGVSLPTGLRQDEDRLLAFSFGNDGSVGLLFGGGIDATMSAYIRTGIDLEFLYLFGNTRERRVKVEATQTDLLFLTKIKAFKEFGWTQHFNIYIESYKFWRDLSFKVNYEFLKHFRDKLWLYDEAINPHIANSAESLQEWTIHNIIFNLTYNPICDLGPNYPVGPYISLFYKVGFNGKRALAGNTLGIALSVSF